MLLRTTFKSFISISVKTIVTANNVRFQNSLRIAHCTWKPNNNLGNKI